jgi:hypothetical protein
VAVNLISPTTLSGLLIGSASTGSLTLTKVAGVPVSAALEIQSSDGALLISRMTEAERDALDVTPGMIIYNLDTGVFNFREGVVWHDITAGSVDGPGISIDMSIPVWNGTSGTHLIGTNVIIDGNDNLLGMETINTTGGFDVDASANVTGVKSLTLALPAEGPLTIDENGRIFNIDSLQGVNPGVAASGQIAGFEVVRVGTGTIAAPALAFGQVAQNGISTTGTRINFSTNGLLQFSILRSTVTVNNLVVGGSNTGVSPSITAEGTDAIIDLAVRPKGSGSSLAVFGSSGASGSIKIFNGVSSFYTKFTGGPISGNLLFTLPGSDAGTFTGPSTTYTALSSNGSGALTFNNNTPSTAAGTLTAAQMAAMYDTPVLLISSPASNQTILVHSLCLSFERPGVATTGGGNIYAQYGNTPHGTNYATPATGIPASFITGASSITEVDGLMGTGILPRASVINQALYLTNDTAVFAGGGSSTLKWFCTFTVIPT